MILFTNIGGRDEKSLLVNTSMTVKQDNISVPMSDRLREAAKNLGELCNIKPEKITFFESLKKSQQNSPPPPQKNVATKLEGGGVKALVAGPLKK